MNGGGKTRAIAVIALFLVLLPVSVSAAFTRPLAQGSVGEDVRELQQFLKDRGFFPLAETTTLFGPITADALAKFQSSVGLEAVGQVGPKTLALLNGSTANAIASPISERPLYLGTRGTDVSNLQQALKSCGFYNYPEITGYFGPITEIAVKAFQAAKGLEQVGFVGPQTRAILTSCGLSSTTPTISTPTATATSTATSTAPRRHSGGGGGGGGSTPAPDTTAPVISNESAAEDGEVAADLSVDTDEANGTLYWVITTSATTPSATQIKAGQNNSGGTAFSSGSQAVSATGAQAIAASSLAPATDFYAHFMHEDSTGNQSNTLSSSSFTTDVNLELNFADNSAYGNGSVRAITDLITTVRASTGYAESSSGVWQSFGTNVARITDKGLLSETSRTNVVQHNRDLTITNQLTVTGGAGTFTDGETVTATGGGTGTYIADNSSATLYAIRGGTGTFSGTLTGGTSGATKTISSAATKWVRTNVTATKDQTGVDGVSNSAASVTASATNATIIQSITDGSRARWVTAFVKRLTGSGTIEMTMDNGSTWTAISPTSSWTRVSIPTQTLANPQIGFRFGTNGDSIAVDFVQSENNGLFGTSPILTTTASATRSADVVTLTDPTLTNISAGTWLTEIGPLPYTTGVVGEIIVMRVDVNNKVVMELYSTNKLKGVIAVGGVLTSDLPSDNDVLPDTNYRATYTYQTDDFAAAYSTNLASTYSTGSSGTTPTGVFTVTFGSNGGSSPLQGYIRHVIWSPLRVSNTALLNWAQD